MLAATDARQKRVITRRKLSRPSERCGRMTAAKTGRSNAAIAEALVVTERAVEKHVTSIFSKLDLTPTVEDHRRVLAVLAYLRASD